MRPVSAGRGDPWFDDRVECLLKYDRTVYFEAFVGLADGDGFRTNHA